MGIWKVERDGARSPVSPTQPDRWGVILAGGDGIRLRPFTRMLVGDNRPKQYCPVLGRTTLLDQTRHRVALSISPQQTLVAVTQSHERFYLPALANLAPSLLIAQPQNRGTALAFLYALLRVATHAPTASVAFFPSDHYVSDDRAFMTYVEDAFEAVRVRPDRVVLLGVEPDRPEVEYGWIEPATPLLTLAEARHLMVWSVRRFWEKPSAAVAQTLQTQGCLWNCFVTVARVPTLLSVILDALPELFHAFAGLQPVLGTSEESRAVRDFYGRLPPTDFSGQVLAARPASLAVLPIRSLTWNDLGEPGRVLATLRQIDALAPSIRTMVGPGLRAAPGVGRGAGPSASMTALDE